MSRTSEEPRVDVGISSTIMTLSLVGRSKMNCAMAMPRATLKISEPCFFSTTLISSRWSGWTKPWSTRTFLAVRSLRGAIMMWVPGDGSTAMPVAMALWLLDGMS